MEMTCKSLSNFSLSSCFLIVILFFSFPTESRHYDVHKPFLQCLSFHLQNDSTTISSIVYTPNNPSYVSILQSSIRNKRFMSSPTANPRVIVAPVKESQVPAIVLCAKENGLQIRTRSGGHDYEGISYQSKLPFVILDLFNLSEITVDVEQKTAWVQTGATNGQVYYAIGQKSKTLAFPGGGCLTIGVGGLYSGGGYGALMRKYGLAADNIIDARMVDVKGRILDRKSMGEDVFWAIRGGGAASFGVITAWKLNLVTVPENVTIFSVARTLEQNATALIHKWQYVGPHISKDLFFLVAIQSINSNEAGRRSIQISFTSQFLGGVDQLLELMGQSFPELGVRREDCIELSWLQSTLLNGGHTLEQPLEILASRNPAVPSSVLATTSSFKTKLDYVKEAMPKRGFEGMWELLLQRAPNTAQLVMIPYGGRMSEIPETAIPFPHRAGNLYKIHQLVYWNHSGPSEESLNWSRRFYEYLTPFVSKLPREGYLNYRDLDFGVNKLGNTSYAQASIWGSRYFVVNFKRLAQVKTIIDPSNYFRNEQSIPLMKN